MRTILALAIAIVATSAFGANPNGVTVDPSTKQLTYPTNRVLPTHAQVQAIDDMSSGGDATNHYHAADRARANHTGTQAWSTLTATPTNRAGYGIVDVPIYTELLDDAPTNSSFYGRLGGAWSVPVVADVAGLQTALDNIGAPVPAAGTLGSVFASTGTETNWYTFRRMDRVHDDLDCGAVPVSAGSSWVLNVASGGSAGASVANAETNATGVIRLTTGTTATGSSYLGFGQTILFGPGNVYEAATRIKLPVLSSATERFFVHAAFYDSATTNATDGAYFQYVHDANSGNFTYVCRSNAVTTASANGTVGPVADTWVSLRCIADANTSTAYFYVNDVLDGTVAGIPTGAGRYTAFRVQIEASGGSTGTGADLMDVDYGDRTILYGVTR